MKKIFFSLFLTGALFAAAQPGGNQPEPANILLRQSFWQTKPDVETVKTTIANGNNPAEQNAANYDPVSMAINAGAPNETILHLLAQEGNDVNKHTHDGRTYIFWAASQGNVALMEHLISKGAKLDKIDNHGASVLTFAAGAGQKNTGVYELLLQNGANLKTDVNRDGANALLLSIGSDPEFKLADYFTSKGLDIKNTDAHGNTAFNYAARAANIDIMKALLARGIKPTDNAMIMAAMGGRRSSSSLETYQFLESVGVKPAAIGKTGENALHFIVRKPDQTEIINYFLSKGVDVNKADEDGNTVFMNAAAANRDPELIKLLLDRTKNINAVNKDGANALALALKGNSTEIAAYLIKNGADIKAVDNKGNNLAYYAVESFSPRSNDVVAKLSLLKEKGLDVSAPQKDGNTLYHQGVAKNSVKLLQEIKPFGAAINKVNKEGFTALHKAAMTSKDTQIIAFLLAAGAKKDIKTEFDETAFDLAKENEFLTKENISVDLLK